MRQTNTDIFSQRPIFIYSPHMCGIPCVPFVLGHMRNTEVKKGIIRVPLGIDDLAGETRNKDNGKCNRYTRDIKSAMGGGGDFFSLG